MVIQLAKTTTKERLGEIKNNNDGCIMKIVEYKRCDDIIVEFQDDIKYKVHTHYDNFKRGYVRNPYFRKEYGVGYIGETKIYADKIRRKPYDCWHAMMSRCYSNKNKNNDIYKLKNCSICEEWHSYANFEKWFNKNYYEVDNEKMALDKDILIKGNNIYSPQTCIFVPIRINSLFIKSDKIRGSFAIGVTKRKNKERYVATSGGKFLGGFKTEIEAFQKYKEEKEKNIKQIADEYKTKIPKILYDAMYKWEVDIND